MRHAGWATVAVLVAVTWSVPSFAQSRGQGMGRGEAVQLIVRPRVGDTLFLAVEQSVSMRGRQVAGSPSSVPPVLQGKRGASPAPEYGPRVDRANTRVSRVQLFAHSLVEASDLQTTTLLATTDSVTMWAGTATDAERPMRVPVSAEGRQVRIMVTPDGAMRVRDPQPDEVALGATLSSVPGLLPDGPVAVGGEWKRDMLLPALPLGAYRAEGVVHARLRLDSLSRGGRLAHISVEGVLRRDGAARELPAGTRMITSGTLRGRMVVDRTRAWITEARTVMDVQSEVAPGPAGAGRPMLMDIRVEQRVRVR